MINISAEAQKALVAPVRFIKPLVHIYFDGVTNTPTDVTPDVMNFDTLEELSASAQLPFGEVSYNDLTIELDNMSGKYSITNKDSIYAGKLVANLKVTITYQVLLEDESFESIPGGVFYTDDWSINSEGKTAILTCYDKLFLYGYKPLDRFRVQRSISFKDAYTLLFKSVGLTSKDYKISTQLLGTLDYFWCTDSSFLPSLNSLAILTASNIYVDRHDVIQVVPINITQPTKLTIRDDNLIMSTKSAPSYNNVYSGIRLHYNTMAANNSKELFSTEELQLQPGENVLTDIPFSATPVIHLTNISLKAPAGCTVKSYDFTDRTLCVKIDNPGDACIASLQVKGSIVNSIQDVIFEERSANINNIMEVTLPLVCTKRFATKYAQDTLALFSSYISSIELDMRGHPALELYDQVQVVSPSSSVDATFRVMKISNKMSEGLTGNISVRII